MGTELDIYTFGRQLIETKDLDPVYVLLHEVQLEPLLLRRWLIAYWGFYHVGTASWIAEGGDRYWDRMQTAAGSKDYPRSSERRHFRGQNALASVAYLESRGSAALFDDLMRCPPSASAVMDVVRTWVGFGPWIAFKIADMLERLGLKCVVFTNADALYESPLEGAKLLWSVEQAGPPPPTVGEWALKRILDRLNPTPAPPRGERLLNAQEAETVLCKYHSYSKGHYYVEKDNHEVQHGLNRFPLCKLTRRLTTAGHKGGLW